MEVVARSWNEPMPHYGMFRYGMKLKWLRSVLRNWNREKVGNIFDNLKAVEDMVKAKEQ